MRSVGTFENLYLARTTNRINEAVNASFAGGPRQPPGATDGVTVGRIMVNELDAARIDPLLSWSVSRVVAKTMEYIVSRSETLVSEIRQGGVAQLTAHPVNIDCQRLFGNVAHWTTGYRCSIDEFQRDKLPVSTGIQP